MEKFMENVHDVLIRMGLDVLPFSACLCMHRSGGRQSRANN